MCYIQGAHSILSSFKGGNAMRKKKKSSFESSIHVYRAMAPMTPQNFANSAFLANRVGVSRQTIIQLERNKYNPSLLLAHDIANVFGVTIDDVFTFKETLNDDVEQEA